MRSGGLSGGRALLCGLMLAVLAPGVAVAEDVTEVATLTPELLSAYVANQQAAKLRRDVPFQPETWAVPAKPDPSIDDAMLSAYVEKGYVPTPERIARRQDERRCLATAIYHEARGEPEAGQWAVADVIFNRVASSRYPSSICGVVYQNADKGKYKCQFSFACDGKPDEGGIGNRIVRESWVRAYVIAEAAMEQRQAGALKETIPENALYYHSTKVNPSWTSELRRVASIGSHIFYAAY
jgi:N-acetylmuramoyl-L-alanine amidase